jgi:hypothetical protein
MEADRPLCASLQVDPVGRRHRVAVGAWGTAICPCALHGLGRLLEVDGQHSGFRRCQSDEEGFLCDLGLQKRHHGASTVSASRRPACVAPLGDLQLVEWLLCCRGCLAFSEPRHRRQFSGSCVSTPARKSCCPLVHAPLKRNIRTLRCGPPIADRQQLVSKSRSAVPVVSTAPMKKEMGNN